jgi:CheY-like chemotaxis protein
MSQSGPQNRDHSRLRVLVAEDDAISSAVCARALKNAGYAVHVVTSGEEALACLRDDSFDLVVTDVMMPAMDGFTLVRAMREDERLTRLPVVFLTGCSAHNMRLRGYRAGGDGYLVKPVAAEELIDEIESLLMSALGTSAQLSGAYLSGRLDGTSVSAILAFLHVQARSGMLRLSRFGATGEIAMLAGEPRAAYLGTDVTGEAALSAMLGWNAGTFRFERFDASESRVNLRGPFAELIERAERARAQQ